MKKIDTLKKHELFELFDDLDQAGKILSEIKGGYSGVFDSAEQFYEVLKDEVYELKHQNSPDFKQICVWFAPTSVWDDFVGLEGMELANRIFERAYNWNKSIS